MLENQVTDVNLAILLASMIRQIQQPNAQSILDTAFADDTRLIVRSNMFRDASVCPTVYWGYSGQTFLMLCNGVESVAMANNLWSGYLPLIPFTEVAGLNTWYRDAVAFIRNKIGATPFANVTNIVLAGYSGGGAILSNLAGTYQDTASRVPIKLITFGAPKPFGRDYLSRLSNVRIARYFFSRDPVPLVPLTLEDSFMVPVLYGKRGVDQFASFIHPSGGIQVSSVPAVQPATMPVQALEGPLTAVGSWLFGLNNTPAPPHSLSTIIAYMQQWLLTNASQNPIRGNPSPATTTNPSNPRQVTRQEAAATSQLFAIGSAQAGVQPQLPAPAIFEAVKSGKIWYVQFSGALIAIGPTRKRSRALARFGNEFLRRLQGEAVVDPAAIVTQFQVYLNNASQPNNGFNPVLNTNFPVPPS